MKNIALTGAVAGLARPTVAILRSAAFTPAAPRLRLDEEVGFREVMRNLRLDEIFDGIERIHVSLACKRDGHP